MLQIFLHELDAPRFVGRLTNDDLNGFCYRLESLRSCHMACTSSFPFPGGGWGAPFCSEPTPVSTKWFWYTVSILQNGLSITHGSTKWKCLSPVLIHKYFDNLVKKWSNQCIHDFIKRRKIPEPFCRASILSRPQRQLPFSQCHFVGFLPSSRLHSFFSEVDPFFSCNFCSMNIFLFFCQQCAGNPSEDGNFFRF